MKLSWVSAVSQTQAMHAQVDQEDALAVIAGQHLVLVEG